jgi:hypothetical protein
MHERYNNTPLQYSIPLYSYPVTHAGALEEEINAYAYTSLTHRI